MEFTERKSSFLSQFFQQTKKDHGDEKYSSPAETRNNDTRREKESERIERKREREKGRPIYELSRNLFRFLIVDFFFFFFLLLTIEPSAAELTSEWKSGREEKEKVDGLNGTSPSSTHSLSFSLFLFSKCVFIPNPSFSNKVK